MNIERYGSGDLDVPNPMRIERAYDTLARGYDRYLARDAWIRQNLWRHFDRVFHAGQHVLEVGCGTGIDTIHLATRGIRITAVDLSSKMLDELRSKVSARSLSSLVDTRTGEACKVLPDLSGPFDGIVSSFAVLNMVDFGSYAKQAARLVRPGGRMVCHMLSPGYVVRPAAQLARRFRGGSAHTDGATLRFGEESVQLTTLPAREIYQRFLAAHFVLRDAYPLGLLVTPRMETWIPQPVLETLGRVEAKLGSLSFLVSAGRFFVLDVERRHE